MKERLDYIDRAKGILIILMVIGHVWQSGPVHNWIYAFHMPAFFIIAGMLLRYTGSYQKNFAKYVKRKIYAYGIPFLFIEALGVLTDIVRHGITLNIKGYAYNTLTGTYNDPNLWFLVTLFLLELVFVAVYKLVKRETVAGMVCLGLFFLAPFVPTGIPVISTLCGAMRYMLCFLLGFYGNRLLEKRDAAAVVLSVAAVTVIAAVFGRNSGNVLSFQNAVFSVAGVAGTYAVLQLCKQPMKNRAGEILAAAGKNSILIYGTHRLYYSIVGVLLGITDYASTPLSAGVLMLIVVAVLEVPTIYVINRWLPFLAGRPMKTATKIHS